MILINNQKTEPYYNLALEEYFLYNCKEDIIILWRNDRSIIVGKNQNTIDEINVKYVGEHKIPVVRRLTGGGAVVHDLGNLNYTIIQNHSEASFTDFAKFTDPVCKYLKQLGVTAGINGRNDITIADQKISGNAQTIKRGRIMHHGTLLFSSNLEMLAEALRPNPAKYESKGIVSVRSRVTNIADYLTAKLSVGEFMQGLFEYFVKAYPDASIYRISEQDEGQIGQLYRDKYSTWEWNYGASPKYNFNKKGKFPFGMVDVRVRINNGIIEEVCLFGDFFSKFDKMELELKLIGTRHKKEEIEQVLNDIKIGDYISGMQQEEFVAMLI